MHVPGNRLSAATTLFGSLANTGMHTVFQLCNAVGLETTHPNYDPDPSLIPTLTQTVGCCVTCGTKNAFDAITHAMVFAFISDVPALFSGRVLEYYAGTVGWCRQSRFQLYSGRCEFVLVIATSRVSLIRYYIYIIGQICICYSARTSFTWRRRSMCAITKCNVTGLSCSRNNNNAVEL